MSTPAKKVPSTNGTPAPAAPKIPAVAKTPAPAAPKTSSGAGPAKTPKTPKPRAKVITFATSEALEAAFAKATAAKLVIGNLSDFIRAALIAKIEAELKN
jgi:hypothetical protein